MIFITVGTQPHQFKRLFDEVVKLVDNGDIMEEIIAQTGSLKLHHPKIKSEQFMSQEDLDYYIDNADIIISHGGVGSILTSIKKNKKVIGVPRLSRFGEHINDHQVDLINALAMKNYIIPVLKIDTLKDSIKNISKFMPPKFISQKDVLIKDIENYIDSLV